MKMDLQEVGWGVDELVWPRTGTATGCTNAVMNLRVL